MRFTMTIWDKHSAAMLYTRLVLLVGLFPPNRADSYYDYEYDYESERDHSPGHLQYFVYDSKSKMYVPYQEDMFPRGRPMKIIIHGWNPSQAPDIQTVAKNQRLELILQELGNSAETVICLDWLYWATTSKIMYLSAAKSTWHVGKELADFLLDLKSKQIIASWASVHLIGHSLGAHVAGVAGHFVHELTHEKIGRITGLDPAGPYFDSLFGSSLANEQSSLNDDDADFVDIVHTNAGGLLGGYVGSRVQAGHVDFYPNGGSDQLQCEKFRELKGAVGSCSHEYSVIYYAMALRQPDIFVACKCADFQTFKSGKCPCNEDSRSPIGELARPTARGKYFLVASVSRLGAGVSTKPGFIEEKPGQTDREAWLPPGQVFSDEDIY